MVYILEYAISYVNIYSYVHADYLTKRKKLNKPPSGESTAAIVSRYAQFDMYRCVRRPVKVMIYCADKPTKDTLKIKGLNVMGSHVKFDEPGQGFKRVEIQNDPGYLPQS